MEFLSAIILGLLGSLHCAGMCGPIAIALPLGDRSWVPRMSGALLYNAGRTVTYATLGAIFGFIGKGFALGGLQQWTSILAGAIMILSVLVPGMGIKSRIINQAIEPLTSFLKRSFGNMMSGGNYSSLFSIGILNGFLPCGLVYIALAAAMVTSRAYEGAFYMLLFGVGTVPMMLGISLAGNIISIRYRRKVTRIIPYFIVLLGVLFILRGSNLGIPYISPKLQDQGGRTYMECCEPKN